MTDRDRHALRVCRDAAINYAEREESVREIERRTVGSPKLDGMPRGSGVGDPTGSLAAGIDYARRRRDAAEKAYKRVRRAAVHACRRIANKHAQKFCEAYYLDGKPFDLACIMSGVKERQCYEYMQKSKEKKPDQ